MGEARHPRPPNLRESDRRVPHLPHTRRRSRCGTTCSSAVTNRISIIPRFSHAVANGGWLRWTKEGIGGGSVEDAFKARAEMMLSDVQKREPATVGDGWTTRKADARTLPDPNDTYTAVITSPPYPNRHDYTRVFGVELVAGRGRRADAAALHGSSLGDDPSRTLASSPDPAA